MSDDELAGQLAAQFAVAVEANETPGFLVEDMWTYFTFGVYAMVEVPSTVTQLKRVVDRMEVDLQGQAKPLCVNCEHEPHSGQCEQRYFRTDYQLGDPNEQCECYTEEPLKDTDDTVRT